MDIWKIDVNTTYKFRKSSLIDIIATEYKSVQKPDVLPSYNVTKKKKSIFLTWNVSLL